MLQYPVPLPPLSLSSPKNQHAQPSSSGTLSASAAPQSDYFRNHNAPARPATTSAASSRSIGSFGRAPKPARPHAFAPFAKELPPPLAIPPFADGPLPSPPVSATSPKPVPRSPYISSSTPWPAIKDTARDARDKDADSRRSSLRLEDVLAPGDRVGPGGTMAGERIAQAPGDDDRTAYEVVRRLGHGSYAVVYLVREVLSERDDCESDGGHSGVVGPLELGSPSSSSGHGHSYGYGFNGNGHSDLDSPLGSNGSDSCIGKGKVEYGREFAIKCLSKANLDEDALQAQLNEVSIHQSLRPHPNIVTLHRTLETPSFLLILLEYVPGEDLFYFLEQARDHSPAPTPDLADPSSATPPTPSLLGAESQLLGRTRLRLIARMFGQMCDAVAAAHEQRVFHRDIKPENFIVTETTGDGGERAVQVKLTDFGLSTTDEESADMDCGSAPYMSYECRNNVAPTYMPRQADVWSLGIVLINMLYHYNPWTDTAQGACSSFSLYLQHPVAFFKDRFAGMTKPVAEFLAHRVFPVPSLPPGAALSAREFGTWARELPAMLGADDSARTLGHRRTSSTGHPIVLGGVSNRPGSRAASTPRSRTASLTPFAADAERAVQPAIPALEEDIEGEDRAHEADDAEEEDEPPSRSESKKRRRRGMRKGRGTTGTGTPAGDDVDVTLDTLAHASQSLAREISRASRGSHGAPSVRSQAASTHSKAPSTHSKTPSAQSKGSGQTGTTSTTGSGTSRGRAPRSPPSPPTMYPINPWGVADTKAPRPLPPKNKTKEKEKEKERADEPAEQPAITKKPSKWRLGFGKNTSNAATQATGGDVSPIEEIAGMDYDRHPSAERERPRANSASGKSMSATASNVTSVINSLNALGGDPPLSAPATATKRDVSAERSRSRSRGRGTGGLQPPPPVPPLPRAFSPTGTVSSAGVTSPSWRTSMASSSAGTSTSAFTRYSNSSRNSVSTTATSVSASSWRTGNSSKPGPGPMPGAHVPPRPNREGEQEREKRERELILAGIDPSRIDPSRQLPKNIKFMTGVPWELDELPRGMSPSPTEHTFSQPPQRKPRPQRSKPKDLKLDTITERPKPLLADAMTSTSELGVPASPDDDMSGSPPGSGKKVNHGQITALAKMLSALRR